MATTSTRSRSRIKVHRDRLRALGLLTIQICVADTRALSFRAEAHCQSAAVAASPHAADDQAFIASLADLPDK